MNAIFATPVAAAEAFVLCISLGMSTEETHKLVYGQAQTECPPASPNEFAELNEMFGEVRFVTDMD